MTPADPETETVDLRRKLWEATRLARSWSMEDGIRREDGLSLLAVLGDAALPVAAVLDGPTIDSEPPASDNTSRASASAHGKPRERAGVVAGEGSDGIEGDEDHAACDAVIALWRLRAEAAEGKLAEITAVCRSAPSPIRHRILAIIGAGGDEGHG